MAINWQSILGVQRLRESARYWLDEGGTAIGDRMELVRLEWHKQWTAGLTLVIAASVFMLFFFGGLIVGSMILLLSFWQTPHWGTTWVALASAWGVVILVAGLLAWRSVRRMARPFALTRQVLAQDLEELKERL